MATMAVAAGAFTSTAAVCPSSSLSSSPTSSAAALSAPLALKRTFKSQALRANNRSRNVRLAPFVVRATSSEDAATDPNKQFEEIVSDAKAKWSKVENKTTVAIYAGGALITLWLSSTIIGAVNSVPLLPKLLELVGLGYTSWFVYRYLLFKSGRKELVSDIEELKGKITGAADTVSGKEDSL